MSDELAREVTRSMRDERGRWEAPDLGWSIDLYCRRDDGLEVMQNRDAAASFFAWRNASIRIQGLGRPGNHYSQSMELKPVNLQPRWFNAAGALLREMKALHREKDNRAAAADMKALRGGP